MTRSTTHSPILFLCAVALLLIGCSRENIASPELASSTAQPEASEAVERARGPGGTVSTPFKAKFETVGGVEDFTDDSCGAPPYFVNVQNGGGQGTHLGRFTVHITFCVDLTAVIDETPLEPGESLPYDRGVGTFVAANGDSLHFTVEGAVLPSEEPGYDFEFADPFVFTGGTGRFAGAAGGGVSDSFVDFSEFRTDHRWTGTLTRVPGS